VETTSKQQPEAVVDVHMMVLLLSADLRSSCYSIAAARAVFSAPPSFLDGGGGAAGGGALFGVRFVVGSRFVGRLSLFRGFSFNEPSWVGVFFSLVIEV
jgi:hypothetical protein